MKTGHIVVPALIGFVLSACSGGGGSHFIPASSANSASSPSATSPVSSSSTADATLSVTIPAPPTTSSSVRRAQYVSPSTNSLTFTPKGGATTVVPLTATSPGCTTSASGSRSCQISLTTPSGTNVPFTVSTFASSNGTGTPLSTVNATQTIVANQVNTINLTLNAVVNSLQVAVSPASFTVGTKTTATVTVNVLDAGGNTIVTATNALVDSSDNPVTIALSDSNTGVSSLSSSTLGTSTITLSYNGGSFSSPLTITAKASSSANSSLATASAEVTPTTAVSANYLWPMSDAHPTTSTGFAASVGSSPLVMTYQDPVDKAQQQAIAPGSGYSYFFNEQSKIHTPNNTPGGVAGAFTISEWIEEVGNDSGGNQTYFDESGGTTTGWSLVSGPSSNLTLHVGSATFETSSGSNLAQNKPVYLTVTYDGAGNWRVDEDGVSVGTAVASWTPNGSYPYIEIGLRIGGGYFMSGYLQNIELWNKTLTVAEDAANYQTADAPSYTETPATAYSFVDGFGVNGHFDQIYGTASNPQDYTQNATKLSTLLVDMGIRHIRNPIDVNFGDPAGIMKTLWSEGISHSAQAEPFVETEAQFQAQFTDGPGLASIQYVEGPNELDIEDSPNWDNCTLQPWIGWGSGAECLQSQLSHIDSAIQSFGYTSIPIVAAPLASTADAAGIGNQSATFSAGNIHYAANGGSPAQSGFAQTLTQEAAYDGSEPAWVTETNGSENDCPSLTNSYSVPDSVLAKYNPRVYTQWWLLGVRHVFFYQFSNFNGTSWDGTFNAVGDARTSLDSSFGCSGLVFDDGTPKPQYTALASMIRLLTDTSTSFTPTPVSFTLSGSLTDVQHITLQKQDGSTWMLLWIEAPDYNASTKATITVPSQSVTITFSKTPSNAAVYAYNTSSWLLQESPLTVSGSSVTVNVTDAISFVRIGSTSAPAVPSGIPTPNPNPNPI